MDGPTDVRIALLGPFAATCGGRPLDLGGPRQRAVLAVLVLARGEVVPVESLVSAVWGDEPPADGVGALQAYVSHLRRRLEPGSAARSRSSVIAREGPGYDVRLPDDAVDIWRFERLLDRAGTASAPETAQLVGEALGLWRGPPLAEWADEPWAEAEIARLAELRAAARERLMAARLERGEAALLVPDLESMTGDEPLREERWRLLVLALYRANRQADALAALRRARATLAEELGVDPGPALRELEEQVLAQSPALAVPAQRTRAPAPPAPASGPVPDDLLDRDRELRAVRGALDDLVAGEPRLLLVEGPAGIGKTRLLTEARRLAAERSVRVLTARGSPLERSFGFGVVRQLFEPELATAERRSALLDGAAASAAPVFDVTPGDSPEGSFAVLHGLYWLAVDLSGDGPLMLAVDDLQWCDSASLRWLAYLARRLDALQILVLGTVRTGEQHPDEELLAELSLEPLSVVLRPEALSLDAVADLVERRLGGPVSPLFALAGHRTTSGNPLLLRQLLRGLEADGVRPDAAHADMVVAVGSRAVSSMVLMRLRRLPGPAADVARAAAVLGDGAPLPAVAALAGLPEPETAAALAALARCEVLRDEQPMAFVHPLVREAVYRDLPAAERALRHERAARLLRAAGATDEQVAAHLLRAPSRADPETVHTLRRAARTAADRGAADSAVTLLRRALAEVRMGDDLRRDVLTELGLIEARVDGAASTEHLLQAYELHEEPRTRADIAVAIARSEVFTSPPGVATAFARDAAAGMSPELTDHRQALLALERTSGYLHGLEPDAWATTDPGEPSGAGPGARMLAATLAFEATIDGVDRPRAVALARSALAGDRLWAVDDGLWVVAATARMLADDDLGDFWTRARATAHARGSLFMALSVSVWEGYWRWRRGELDEALACLTAALDQDRMWGGTGIALPYTRSFQIGCHLDRGDVAAARRVADAAVEGPTSGEGGRLLEHAVSRLLAVEGRPADALARLDAIPMPVPVRNPAWNPWLTTAAIALDRLGRRDQAVSLMEEEVRRLRRWGAPSYLGTALCRLGELRGGDGLDDAREAVEVLTPTPAAVELARARCLLGLREQLPDDEAVELLRTALDTALDRGALGIQRRARAGLARRGRPDDGGRLSERFPTSTERRILELAVAGHGVRDVAQRLFLTPGTVQAVLESASGDGLKLSSSPPIDARSPATGRVP